MKYKNFIYDATIGYLPHLTAHRSGTEIPYHFSHYHSGSPITQ